MSKKPHSNKINLPFEVAVERLLQAPPSKQQPRETAKKPLAKPKKK